MGEDRFEHVAHVEVVRVPLIVKDVAPGNRRPVKMPEQSLLIERQRCEPVRVHLHDGRIIHPLEPIGAGRAGCGAGARRRR